MIVVAFLIPLLILVLSTVIYAILHPVHAFYLLLLRASQAVLVVVVLACVGVGILTALGAPLPSWSLAVAAAAVIVLGALHLGLIQPRLIRRLEGRR